MLAKILEHKRREVKAKKSARYLADLKAKIREAPAPIGFYQAYPGLTVRDIHALLADARGGAA